jgi:hypothetical protein
LGAAGDLLVLAAFVVAALLNPFGQRPTTVQAAGPAPSMKLYAPDRLRGGLIYEARLRITTGAGASPQGVRPWGRLAADDRRAATSARASAAVCCSGSRTSTVMVPAIANVILTSSLADTPSEPWSSSSALPGDGGCTEVAVGRRATLFSAGPRTLGVSEA